MFEEFFLISLDFDDLLVFFDFTIGEFWSFGTGVWNMIYVAKVGFFYVVVGCVVLEVTFGIDVVDVIYVIMVFCMGFYALGFDFEIVWDFELRVGVQCYYFGFMGCYVLFFVF